MNYTKTDHGLIVPEIKNEKLLIFFYENRDELHKKREITESFEIKNNIEEV